MSALQGEPRALEPGEAYQRCLRELGNPHPDWQAAHVYATLSLEETLRDVVARLVEATLADRRQ